MNTATGEISGKPTTSGTNNITISATNAFGTGNQTLTLFINLNPTITSPTTATATVGQSFRYAITTDNATTLFAATGLTLNPDTGVISGTPTTAATTILTISATNADGTGTQSLNLTVNPIQLSVNPAAALAAVGQPFRYAITFISAPARFTASALPAGLSFDSITGVVSGTPTTLGISTITLSASDATRTGTQTLTLTVDYPPMMMINYNVTRNVFELMILDEAAQEYAIEYTDNFQSWTALPTKVVGIADLTQIDPQAPNRPHRFYRVIKQ